MKRAIAIFFLSVFMLSATELHQLLKLPVLVEHYREHRKLDHGMTLMRFLVIHYRVNPEKNSDYQRDRQLPFKTADCAASVFSVLYTPASFEIKMTLPVVVAEYNNLDDENFSNRPPAAIFQPPRLA